MRGGGALERAIAKALVEISMQYNQPAQPQSITQSITRSIARPLEKTQHPKAVSVSPTPYYVTTIPIKLTGRYLKQYKQFVAWVSRQSTPDPLYTTLYHDGFFEYQWKLKQQLTRCGLNRTTQLYGTCWLNTIINSIIFGDNFRGRFMQLLDRYLGANPDAIQTVRHLGTTKYRLVDTIELDKKQMFDHLISILYKILCDEGLRNADPKKYDNMTLTNFALSIRQTRDLPHDQMPVVYDVPEKILASGEIANYVDTSLSILLNLFNTHIDSTTSPHLAHVGAVNKDTVFALSNPHHINTLCLKIAQSDTFWLYPDMYHGHEYHFKNVQIDIMYNAKQHILATPHHTPQHKHGYMLRDMADVHFIFLESHADDWQLTQIPETFECMVNGTKTQFKLDSAILGFRWAGSNGTRGSHVISGLICDGRYYVYDQEPNWYFDIDWRDMSHDNFKPIARTAAEKSQIYGFHLQTAIYYNTTHDFTYKVKNCNPRRPSGRQSTPSGRQST
jgi:hypothetical protein